jgi:hypothetical protein
VTDILRQDVTPAPATNAAPEPAPPVERRPRAASPVSAKTTPEVASPPAAAPAPEIVEVQPSPEVPGSPDADAQAGRSALASICAREDFVRDAVTLRYAPVYADSPQVETPVTTLASGILVTVTGRSGDWLLVRFDYQGSGQRTGYAHCSDFRALTNELSSEPSSTEPQRLIRAVEQTR